MRHIEVKYQNNIHDIVPDFMLHQLISSLKIKQFYRFSEERWVTVGSDRIRGIGGFYSGPERRLEEQLAERGAEMERMTKVLRDKVEENQRILVEFDKIRTSLEEQLAERGAEIERIRAEHESKLQEWRGIIDNLSFRLNNSKI